MATQFGATTGVFGIPTQQTGFLLDGTSEDYENDRKSVKNISGDDTGLAYYNERAPFTISGWVPSASPFAGSIASTLALANTIDDHFAGSGGGLSIVEKISKTRSSEDFRRIELSGVNFPFVVAA